MTFVNFDAEYVARLRAADPETEAHFTRYFGDLLFLKLRYRIRSAELVEDIRQETLLRVIRILRQKGIDHPERLGGFVHSVCNNVIFEQLRQDSRHLPIHEDAPEPSDSRVDLEAPLHSADLRHLIAAVLDQLASKDRAILRMIFLEERPKEEICRELAVDPDYLRVLLHRAKSRFRAEYLKRQPPTRTPARAKAS